MQFKMLGLNFIQITFLIQSLLKQKIKLKKFINKALSEKINLRKVDNQTLSVAFDEAKRLDHVNLLLKIFGV